MCVWGFVFVQIVAMAAINFILARVLLLIEGGSYLIAAYEGCTKHAGCDRQRISAGPKAVFCNTSGPSK